MLLGLGDRFQLDGKDMTVRSMELTVGPEEGEGMTQRGRLVGEEISGTLVLTEFGKRFFPDPAQPRTDSCVAVSRRDTPRK